MDYILKRLFFEEALIVVKKNLNDVFWEAKTRIVRRNQGIGKSPQFTILGKRFFLKNIEYGGANHLFFQRPNKISLNDSVSAPYI